MATMALIWESHTVPRFMLRHQVQLSSAGTGVGTADTASTSWSRTRTALRLFTPITATTLFLLVPMLSEVRLSALSVQPENQPARISTSRSAEQGIHFKKPTTNLSTIRQAHGGTSSEPQSNSEQGRTTGSRFRAESKNNQQPTTHNLPPASCD